MSTPGGINPPVIRSLTSGDLIRRKKHTAAYAAAQRALTIYLEAEATFNAAHNKVLAYDTAVNAGAPGKLGDLVDANNEAATAVDDADEALKKAISACSPERGYHVSAAENAAVAAAAAANRVKHFTDIINAAVAKQSRQSRRQSKRLVTPHSVIPTITKEGGRRRRSKKQKPRMSKRRKFTKSKK
jgi:hypothetical protein